MNAIRAVLIGEEKEKQAEKKKKTAGENRNSKADQTRLNTNR